MPTLHRLAVFRDDLVFVFLLYQRWIYPIDKQRANEFGCVPCRCAPDRALRRWAALISLGEEVDRRETQSGLVRDEAWGFTVFRYTIRSQQ